MGDSSSPEKTDKSSNEDDKERDFVLENDWMIRPCETYKAEYNNCTSLKSRFYQYYRDGSPEDCKPYYKNRTDCVFYTRNQDFDAGARVIRSEMKRVQDRLTAHRNNDVWEPRTERPPPNWNVPLPEELQKRIEESYLIDKDEDIKQTYCSRSTCVIM